jgi:hypothetical protein
MVQYTDNVGRVARQKNEKNVILIIFFLIAQHTRSARATVQFVHYVCGSRGSREHLAMAEDYLKVVGTLNRGYTQVRAPSND